MDPKAFYQPHPGEEEDASAEIQNPPISPGRPANSAELNPGSSFCHGTGSIPADLEFVKVNPSFGFPFGERGKPQKGKEKEGTKTNMALIKMTWTPGIRGTEPFIPKY